MSPKYPPVIEGLHLIHQGKTRDTFSTGDDHTRLIVATQRLSTHNIVHKSKVPYKDEVLTALTIFWAQLLEQEDIGTHIVAYGRKIYDHLPSGIAYPRNLHHIAIVAETLNMIPVEFIFRSYLCGSLYKEFYKKGLPNPYGIPLDVGFPLMHRFGKPLFTPTDKSETDDPLDSDSTRLSYTEPTATCQKAFQIIGEFLRTKGLELVDSKMEGGMTFRGVFRIGDEIVTPDSSRFVRLGNIVTGQEPPWADKQIARDEAEKVWAGGPKAPLEFSADTITRLSQTYTSIFSAITDQSLDDFQKNVFD